MFLGGFLLNEKSYSESKFEKHGGFIISGSELLNDDGPEHGHSGAVRQLPKPPGPLKHGDVV